nr:hypothetical protein [Deltaproteobacteria bacterium]
DMREVIENVHLRIERFAMGRAEKQVLEGEYRRIGGGADWTMVEVDHLQARERMVTAGVRAAVEVTGRHGDHYIYSVWRRSEYIVWFPVRAILDSLSEAEGIAPGHPGWGGADNVGGSPRPADRERAYAAGFDLHVVKPTNLVVMRRVLEMGSLYHSSALPAGAFVTPRMLG